MLEYKGIHHNETSIVQILVCVKLYWEKEIEREGGGQGYMIFDVYSFIKKKAHSKTKTRTITKLTVKWLNWFVFVLLFFTFWFKHKQCSLMCIDNHPLSKKSPHLNFCCKVYEIIWIIFNAKFIFFILGKLFFDM